ncbi:MAG: copper resistance protein CopC [Actinomycetota bacterium]|nr:copper resistance protein CopC [Actinomycetota bacterium]
MRIRRVLARSALLAFVFVLTLIGLTGTASAHAQLQASDPHANDVLQNAPQWVTLTFGEPVEVADNAIEVFDDHLKRVDETTVSRVASDVNKVRVRLPAGLRVGTYTVSWHVSSADTHPVSGTFRFSVGAPSQVSGKVPVFGRNNSAGALLGIVRVLGYAGLILGPGALLVTLALWPAGLTLPRTRRILYLGLTLLGTSAIGSMFLEGVWASGEPLRAIWVAPGSLDSHSRKFDTLYAFRSYLLVLFGVLLVTALSTQTRIAERVAATSRRKPRGVSPAVRPPVPHGLTLAVLTVSTLLLMATWTLAGHSATGIQTPWAIAANMLHLAAMAVWLGGLVVVSVSLRPAERAADLAAVLPRFSRVAFTCVMVLVATGSYQAWREVGTIAALYRTTFGRVLLVKIVAVIVVVALGGVARRWVQRHLNGSTSQFMSPLPATGATGARPLRRAGGTAVLERQPVAAPSDARNPVRGLQRGVLMELGIGLLVLALTAALVVTVPARQSYLRPFTRTLTTTGLQVSVRIDAPRTGDTLLRMTARSADGKPVPVTGMRATMALPKAGLGPLPLRLPNAAGSAVSGSEKVGLTFPRRGNWVISLTVQTSPFDATAFSITVPVT